VYIYFTNYRLYLLFQVHLQLSQIYPKTKSCKSLPKKTTRIPRQSYSETLSLHPDNFKISPKPNTDGMGNCLQQPGQLDNQHQKSMRLNLISLNKFCLPRLLLLPRAAGHRSVVFVFAEPSRQLYLDMTNLALLSRLGTV
jgi:hypothetical protein